MDEFSWTDELFVRIAGQIEYTGWAVVYVGGGPCAFPGCSGDHESDLDLFGLPPFGYTVGLPSRFDHPEIIAVGLEKELTTRLLELIGAGIAAGMCLKAGDEVEIEDSRVKIGAVAVARVRDGIVGVSMDYHEAIGHHTFPNPLQILWPDRSSRFPDDRRCDPKARRIQPILARPRARDRARR